VFDRPDLELPVGPVIGRRKLFAMALAAGAMAPLVGAGMGTAEAAAGESFYPIPEESGAIPWW
jgi:hypothetical protein